MHRPLTHCPNTTTYNPNSTYQANLKRLLLNLSSTNTLFFNATEGNVAPDVVYGMVFCRGDLTIDACRECAGAATTEVIKRCPKEKESFIWYGECMLRYNNISFFGQMQDTFPGRIMGNANNVSDPDRFDQILGDTMNKLITRASGTESAGSLKFFATEDVPYTSVLRLYNLVQCTPDLSDLECGRCLSTALGNRPAGKQGGRVMYASCTIRYETYPFYNNDVALTPSPPPLAPPPTAEVPDKGSGGNGRLSTGVITGIVVAVIISVVLFILVFCILRRKAKKQQNVIINATEGVDANAISAAESLRYDLNNVKAATNNFCVDNKIGEGGFGEVFKGSLNGQQIAVKRLSKSSGQGEQEFKNEVLVVAKLQHRNLVRLLGYCLDEGEKILIYEFVPNKSLNFILFVVPHEGVSHENHNSELSMSINSAFLHEEPEKSSCSVVSDFPYCPMNANSYKDLVFHGKYEAKEFYSRYGKKKGFGVRLGPSVKKTMKTTNIVYVRYIHLYCRKAGKKKTNENPGAEPSYERAEIRTGCKATLKLVMDWDKQGYVIYGWNDEHNHAMIDDDKVSLIRTFRQIRPEHKVMIDIHVNNGINVRSTFDALRDTYGSVDDMGFTRADLWNYVSSVKRKAMFEGDAIVMHKWLMNQASSHPGFFYNIEVDEERRIKTVFWADAVMISDYGKFGDFVSFDTTYRTNDTARPLGIFVGFNHHKCTTIFGAALMYDETSASFKWVFETFLKCMSMKLPKTIMTDQAPAIALAIRQVFVGVFHALCSWHIDQNARKRLGSRADSTFLDLLNQLMRYVDSEREFDFVWDKMLDTCFDGKPTSDNSWLSFIHTFRKQWSSAWVKNEFTAGKTTTQLSEQLNAFARHYLKRELHVSELMRRFQALVDDLRFNEKLRDYHMQDTIPANHFKNSRLMSEAAQLFTPRVFKFIQQEYESGMSYDIMEITAVEEHMLYSFQETMRVFTGQCKLFRVQRWDQDNSVDKILVEEEIVRLDIGQEYVKCSCRFLENSWLVCRHVLRVLDVHAAFGNEFCKRIPKLYCIERWMRKAAKPCVVHSINNEVIPSTYGQRYQRLYNHAVAVGTRICYNQEAFEAYMQCCYEGAKQADEILQKPSTTKPSRAEFSSTIDGEDNFYESFKPKNPRTVDKDGSKVRLMSNIETRHLKWKQNLRREMEQQQ